METHEGRRVSLGEWLLRQPVSDSHQVHRTRNENVLQMRFSQADVACPSQVKAAYAIGKGPLNASAPGIMFGEGLSFFACSGSLQGFVWSGDAQSRYAGAGSRVLPFLTILLANYLASAELP